MTDEEIEKAAKNVYRKQRPTKRELDNRHELVADMAKEVGLQWEAVVTARAAACGASTHIGFWREDEVRRLLVEVAVYYKLAKATAARYKEMEDDKNA